MFTQLYRWSKESIASEIRGLYLDGQELNYTSAERNHTALLRAACRHFGSWRSAIEFTGLDYDEIRKYRAWTDERILERIQELRGQGIDLSWRHICDKVDPGLAAAAVRSERFGGWGAALEAAGLDYEEIRRYRAWNNDAVISEMREMHELGHPLNSRTVQDGTTPLFHAARRRFEGWDGALQAAGFDACRIRKRQKPPVEG